MQICNSNIEIGHFGVEDIVDTVGKNTQKIKEYIANQLKEDKIAEQIAITEVVDPFKK